MPSLFANEYFIPQCSISIDIRTYFWINKKYREENNYILSEKTLSVLNKLDARIIYFKNKRNIKNRTFSLLPQNHKGLMLEWVADF